MFRDPDLGIGVDNATFVLVRQEIGFLQELRWPRAMSRSAQQLAELGRSSFTSCRPSSTAIISAPAEAALRW
jgi:hypothetical protein